MAKRKLRKAAKYLRAHEVPERIVRPDQLQRASEESGETMSQTLDTVSKMLQAGSGLGPAPMTRQLLERGYLRG